MAPGLAIRIILLAIALTSCATDQSGKPILTAKAVSRITADCGAITGKFHRHRKSLPYASFVLRRDEVARSDGPTSTVYCIGKALDSYRYWHFEFRDDEQTTH